MFSAGYVQRQRSATVPGTTVPSSSSLSSRVGGAPAPGTRVVVVSSDVTVDVPSPGRPNSAAFSRGLPSAPSSVASATSSTGSSASGGPFGRDPFGRDAFSGNTSGRGGITTSLSAGLGIGAPTGPFGLAPLPLLSPGSATGSASPGQGGGGMAVGDRFRVPYLVPSSPRSTGSGASAVSGSAFVVPASPLAPFHQQLQQQPSSSTSSSTSPQLQSSQQHMWGGNGSTGGATLPSPKGGVGPVPATSNTSNTSNSPTSSTLGRSPVHPVSPFTLGASATVPGAGPVISAGA